MQAGHKQVCRSLIIIKNPRAYYVVFSDNLTIIARMHNWVNRYIGTKQRKLSTMRNNFNTLSSQEETSVNYRKKVAAATLAITGLISAGCSSEGSASGGGLFNSSREVVAGEECSSRTDIHNIGTFSPVDTHHSEPFPGGTVDPAGIALRDGLSSRVGDRPFGTLVNIDTFSDDQLQQLEDSYNMMVEQITPEEGSGSRPSYQNGFVVLYGEKLPLSENELRSEDGVVDSEDLQVCVFAEKGQGSVTNSQFLR